jgi:hypothetical protein
LDAPRVLVEKGAYCTRVELVVQPHVPFAVRVAIGQVDECVIQSGILGDPIPHRVGVNADADAITIFSIVKYPVTRTTAGNGDPRINVVRSQIAWS